jgi:hypothetical protein
MKLVARHELEGLPEGSIYFPYDIYNKERFGVEKRTTPEGTAADKGLLDDPDWRVLRMNGEYWVVLEKEDIETMIERLQAGLKTLGAAVSGFMDTHRDALTAAAQHQREGKEFYLVWNEAKTEGFVSTDKQLAYEVRKSSDSNCFDENGNRSNVGVAFCDNWGEDNCTMHKVEPSGKDGAYVISKLY